MSKQITLASGQITRSPHDAITVELLEPAAGEPAIVRVVWPSQPTITSAIKLDAMIAAATRVLTNSVLELARLSNGNQR